MNKLVCLAFILLCVVPLQACAKAAVPADTPIEPGDRIGDFLITTGAEGTSQLAPADCAQYGKTAATCTVSISRKINVSYGVFDDSRTGKLNALWSNYTYEMQIEGRPVDLQAFGPVDVYRPTLGTTRKWNVVISADKPGAITIRHAALAGGEHAEGTMTLVFVAP